MTVKGSFWSDLLLLPVFGEKILPLLLRPVGGRLSLERPSFPCLFAICEEQQQQQRQSTTDRTMGCERELTERVEVIEPARKESCD